MCFDLAAGRESRRWATPGEISTLDFNPDNRRLAVGYSSSSFVSIYDAHRGRLLADLPVGDSTAEVVAWHPDGNLLAAAGSDPRIQIWNVAEKHRIAAAEGHVQRVTRLSFHPSGSVLASGSWDGDLRLWHPAPTRLLMRLPLPSVVKFGKDGGWAGVIWQTDHQAQPWRVIPSREYCTFVGALGDTELGSYEGDISPDGTLLALGSMNGVRLWDAVRCREVAWLPLGDTPGVLFRADGRELLTCGQTEGLQRWSISADPESESGLQVGPPHRIPLPFAPTRMAGGGNDQVAAVVGEETGQVALLDLDSEILRGPARAHAGVGYVALSPDRKWVATSGWHSSQVRLWNAASRELVQVLEVGMTARAFFTPDSKELIIARGSEFMFRDIKTLAVTRRWPRESGVYPGYIAFSPDGNLMALETTPGVILLKETASDRTIAKLRDPQGDISTWMSFSPDGTQLIVAARYAGAIHRWDLRHIRTRLKTMGLDWDWPAFPPTPRSEGMLGHGHHQPGAQVVALQTATPPARAQPAKP